MKKPSRFSSAPALLGMLISAMVVSCNKSSGNTGTDTKTTDPDAGADGADNTPDEIASIGLDPEALFDWEHVPRFDIALPQERLTALLENAAAEEYVEAELLFEGEPVGRVGLRFKGSWGSLQACIDADGSLICDKLSMKLRFDSYNPDRRFFGMKRLNFNSMIYDHTWLRERLAYDLYRAALVVAPRSAWAIVTVNGVSHGLFDMVEQVDGRFTEDRWPENGDGNLYKEVWPGNAVDEATLDTQLRTNEEEADHRAVMAFNQELAAADAEGPAALNETLKRFMDVDYLSRLFAVEDAVNAADGMTVFYANSNGVGRSNHNQYLYQEEDSDFFWLIPWDMDTTFWTNNDAIRLPHWTTMRADCAEVYRIYDGNTFVTAAGCDLLFKALAVDAEPYRRAVAALVDGPYEEATILAKVDAYAAFIRSAVAEDPFVDFGEWEMRVAEIKKNIPILRARVAALGEGLGVNPLALVGEALNTFNDYEAIDAMVGATVSSNASSEGRVSLVPDDMGEAEDQALRFDFAYRDDRDPWQHWVVMDLPMVLNKGDISHRAGLRLAARSDQARSVRIEMVGYAHTAQGLYRYEGWDFPVTTEWATMELPFDTAQLPSYATAEDLAAELPLEEILKDLQKLRIFPECLGRGGEGFLGEGQSDTGFLEIDDVEIYATATAEPEAVR